MTTPRTPVRLNHLVSVLRIRLNRIAGTSDTNKIWLEARESLEVLRQLEAVMPNEKLRDAGKSGVKQH